MSEEQATPEVNEGNENQEQQTEAPKEAPKPSGSAFYKQKLLEAEAERQRLADELEAERTRKLQEKEDYKQLWENEKNKRNEIEEKNRTLSQTVFNNFKSSAIKEEALKMGILSSAVDDLDLVDSSMVEVETTDQGRINILGAKEFVEVLKEKKPHWFNLNRAPSVNVNRPGEPAAPRDLSPKEVLELQKKDPKAYRDYMHKRLSLA